MSLDSVAVAPVLRRSGATPNPFPRVGIAGLLLAVSAVALEVLAITIGSVSASFWGAAVVLAWVVIGFQAVSVVLGLVAMVSGRGNGRRFGLAAAILSMLSNPLVLVGAFSLVRGIA